MKKKEKYYCAQSSMFPLKQCTRDHFDFLHLLHPAASEHENRDWDNTRYSFRKQTKVYLHMKSSVIRGLRFAPFPAHSCSNVKDADPDVKQVSGRL